MASRLGIVLVALLGFGAADSAARPPGPKLHVSDKTVARALSCPKGLKHKRRSPVLLVHGTATNAAESWPDGLAKSLALSGFDWCTVDLPERALADIQSTNEYVVAATRIVHRRSGRKVSLAGHSQGGLQIRWSLRFWPDLRKKVRDLITFAGANDGVTSATTICETGSCDPAVWQMNIGSLLEAAVNAKRMPKGPSYTAIYSQTDDLVQPPTSGAFEGASNILIQDLCPGRYVGHVQLVFDAVAIAAALDALEHRGPGNAERVGSGPCAEQFGPGIDPAVAPGAIATVYANGLQSITEHPDVDAEPALRPYARAR